MASRGRREGEEGVVAGRGAGDAVESREPLSVNEMFEIAQEHVDSAEAASDAGLARAPGAGDGADAPLLAPVRAEMDRPTGGMRYPRVPTGVAGLIRRGAGMVFPADGHNPGAQVTVVPDFEQVGRLKDQLHDISEPREQHILLEMLRLTIINDPHNNPTRARPIESQIAPFIVTAENPMEARMACLRDFIAMGGRYEAQRGSLLFDCVSTAISMVHELIVTPRLSAGNEEQKDGIDLSRREGGPR